MSNPKEEHKQVADQTAAGIVGIPTPADQQSVTPTDMVDGGIEEMIDNLQESFGSHAPKTRSDADLKNGTRKVDKWPEDEDD